MMQAIVAVGRNWGIGRDNCLIFDIPEDMAFFRETTRGATVIMGRRTLLSLPGGKPLKGRRNIVLSTREEFVPPEGAELARNPEEAARLSQADEKVFVVGGQQVYKAMLPFCDKIYVTVVDAEPPCDCFFPNLDEDPEWERAETGPDRESGGFTFRIVTFIRKK